MFNIILQTIIVLFPQSVLGSAFCLLLNDKFDLMDFDKISGRIKFHNTALIKISICSFIFSFLCIFLRHLRFSLFFGPIILLVSTFIIMLIAYRINKLSHAVKLFLSLCLWCLLQSIVELIVTPIIINMKGITVYDVFDSVYINFITSIPCIIIMFFLDIFLFIKRKNFLNINILKMIIHSKILTCATMFLIFVNIVMMGIYVIIVNDKILEVYSANIQIVMNTILMTFPGINLGGIWFLLYSVKYKEAFEMRIERDEMIKEMSIVKERSRVAREVHDTLGHSLTVIIKLLEVCKITSKTDFEKMDEQLEEAIRIAQNGTREVKHSVSGILEEKILNQDFFSSLMELVSEFENNSGITVNFTTQGPTEEISKKNAFVLYSVCKEALTNSLRHGKAKNIGIIIKFESKAIKLSIFDDGLGCGKIQEGFGLKGMEQRISDVNGKMSYKSDKGQGFILNFEVPKEEFGMLA